MAIVSDSTSTSADSQPAPAAVPRAIPFRTELSLAPLITFWTQTSTYSEFGRGPLPGIVREKVKHAPELTRVIEDLSVIGQHKALVDLMMTAMFLYAASGLVIYWTVSNIWGIGQQMITNRLIGPATVRTVRPPAERRVKNVGGGRTDQAKER